MTPAYLNPPSSPCPLVEQREEDQHLKLFISPHDHQASSSLLRHGNGEINSPNCINNTIRVCADCNTTTTPLWRSGPRGPKARRAMAEAAAAANGIVVSTNNSTTKSYKVHNKEKKSRKSHGAQYKTKCKLMDTSHSKRKLAFKDLALSLRNNSTFGSVFPQDEAEGALLLMELSCGLVHNTVSNLRLSYGYYIAKELVASL
ncbi:putative gata transcription factor 22 [Quercus suber]|uniref:Gata transcription factor 22 n=1 Tax=Quercus suber TaxID=58331 RepID=A0AAW0JYA7_QUESU